MDAINQLLSGGLLSRLRGEGNAGTDSDSAARRRWLVLGLTVAAQFMVILDVAVVNVALPAIKSDLGFSQEGLQWIVTAYAILFGGALLLGGRLADLLGRRRLFAAGVAVFTVGSLLSGMAWSEGSLIAFRALQGLGGALLSPAALSIVVTTFAEGRERNTALGIWGAASGSGGAVGVLLGGVLTSYFGWSWIFFINLPVGIAILALTPVLLSESRADAGHRHFDVAGAASITGGLMLAVYAMTRATDHGWGDAIVLVTLAGAAALVAAFLVIERRSPAPLLPPRIFRIRTLSSSNVVMLLIGAGTFAEFFLLTLYLQQVLHYSAIETGLAFIAITATIAVGSNVGQLLTTRFGSRRVLIAGMLLSAVSSLLYARMPVGADYLTEVLPAFLIGGAGLALAFVPVTVAGLTAVTRADAGVASGLINTTRQMGGAIGLAAVTTVATTATVGYLGSHPAASHAAALTHGFDVAFYLLAALALVGAAVATTLPGPARGERAESSEADVESFASAPGEPAPAFALAGAGTGEAMMDIPDHSPRPHATAVTARRGERHEASPRAHARR